MNDAPLREAAPASPSALSFAADETVWLLGLDQVEAQSGRVLEKVMGPASEAGSSTQAFDEGNVLYCKLRPYLNKVVIPGSAGLCTTELVPLRPRLGLLDRRYLAHYLRSPRFVRWASTKVAGAKMPRVRMKEFWAHRIPLPPITEQERVVEILDKADALRAKRRESLAQLDTLLQSVFVDMFGDPFINPMGWDVVDLSTLVAPTDKINYGVVQPGGDFPGGKPLIRVGDFVGGEFVTDKVKLIDPAIDEKYKRSRLSGRELLISCVGSIGVVCKVPQDVKGFNIARAVARVPLKHGVRRDFVLHCLRAEAVQRYFRKETRTVSQPTLNIGLIKQAPVIQPPDDIQKSFVEIAEAIEAQRRRQRAHLAELKVLFVSLQCRAFSGEL